MKTENNLQLILKAADSYIQNHFEQAFKQMLAQFPKLSIESKTPPKVNVLTSNGVCKLLEISLPTLHEWRKTGKIPYKRIGRRVYFIEADVLAALQSFERRAK